jgi:hypothetical protein
MRNAQQRILPRGFGPIGSFNLALVGSLLLVTSAAGATSSGDRTKKPAMKSSTMKGAKALESKLWMETVPNREQPSFLGKGKLLVSYPRNRRHLLAETMACREVGTWSDGVEVVPPSDVTFRAKSSLIREGSLLPPVVRRCLGGATAIAWPAPLAGNEVFQRQRTGRVAQVGAARPFFGEEPRARLLQGSGKLVPVSGWHRARKGRRKSGRVKPDINSVHYWLSVMLPRERGFTWLCEALFGERASHSNERQSRSCSSKLVFEKGIKRKEKQCSKS